MTDVTLRKNITEALENHGLVGSLLQSKLLFLTSATGKVHEYLLSVPRIEETLLRKVLAWLLDLLDDYLDSLTAAFPALGVVSEFKKALETGLNAPEELM